MGRNDENPFSDAGYNLVRHPREGIAPLDLIGRSGRNIAQLGRLRHLVEGGGEDLPITRDLAAGELSGTSTRASGFKAGLGFLTNVLKVFGVKVGAKLDLSKTKDVTFAYDDLRKDRVLPMDIGDFLDERVARKEHPVLRPFLRNNGDLYVISEVLYSDSLRVDYGAAGRIGLGIDATAPGDVGGNVSVNPNNASSREVTYEGDRRLAVAFRCLSVRYADDKFFLDLTGAGEVFLGGADGELFDEGVVDLAEAT